MKNLENYGVQELNTKETEGGWILSALQISALRSNPNFWQH